MRNAILAALFTASSAFADCNTPSVFDCPTQAAAESLGAGDCTAFDGTPYDVWSVGGTTGESIEVDVSSTAFDTLLILLDPDGEPVAVNDDRFDGTTHSRLTYTFPASGTYTFLVTSLSSTGAGDYGVTWSCPATTPSGPRRRSVRH